MWALDWKKDWKWLKRKYIFIYRNILSLKIVWADKHHNKKTSWSWNVQPSMFEVTSKQLKLDIMFLHQFKRNTKPPSLPQKNKRNKKKRKKKDLILFPQAESQPAKYEQFIEVTLKSSFVPVWSINVTCIESYCCSIVRFLRR